MLSESQIEMKIIFLIVSLILVNLTRSIPVEDDDCLSLFSSEVCAAYENLRIKDEPKHGYSGYQDVDFLTNALKMKLDFLVRLGLLSKIPLVGDALNDFVANNQDLIAGVVKGGISGLIKLIPLLLSFVG
ncbi:uncharacterized protein LOC105843803 isoform X1 [Hydra vulgaris]|uniref:uncharacterized protein LOC105843803 isoform X1 n=1 Tax=Hydra vulgaris TaxID=6087 RepID=UPI001F5F3111|nr:uncharacterized protein LOC105843803 [Hydra vulgaris]